MKDVENHKLCTLASYKLDLDCSNAHDAIFEVEVLKKLSEKYLTLNDMENYNWSFNDILVYFERKERSKLNADSFLPLKEVVSKSMLQRLSESSFSYDDLVEIYKNDKEKAKDLLEGKINGKAQIIKTKKVLSSILDHLKSLQ